MIKNSEKSIKIDVMNSLLIDDANFVTFFTRGCFVAPRAEIPLSPLMVSCPRVMFNRSKLGIPCTFGPGH